MAINLAEGIKLRLDLRQDLVLEYRCFTEVVQEFSNAGKLLGTKEHAWDTRLNQRVIRRENEIAHVITVSDPLGDIPKEPIMGSQVTRQMMYSQMNDLGVILEYIGGNNPVSYAFPEEAVKVGSKWQRQTHIILPGMPYPAPATNEFEVKGEERVGGYDCIRIDMKSSAAQFEMMLPDGQQKANVVSETSGSVFFAPSIGALVRIELTTRSIPKIEGFAFNTITKLIQELVTCDKPNA